ncbi:WecB/TagA/CpsF family glycosyltransferase [Candidatus Halobeggiatoa sp. HSG11]|nr:WecB/TagA/CpsF family glycosyltransferase [Candidatus Halobeggiatoa sp. HSG11]
MYHTIRIFELEFISATHHLKVIDDLIDYQNNPNYSSKLPFVITVNADQLVKLDKLSSLKSTLSQAMFIFPDGHPIVWCSRLIRKPLKARLTGSDLFPLLLQKAKEKQQKILIIVSQAEIGTKLQADYPNISYYAPPFFKTNSDSFEKIHTDIVNIIKDFKPQFVIIGLGFPKQEWLGLSIHKTLQAQSIPSPLFLFLGASAEFHIGMKKRAPIFFQKVGMEWLYRLLQEPKRMWKRYILGVIPLLKLCVKELKK